MGRFPRVSPGAEFMPPLRGVAVMRALWSPTHFTVRLWNGWGTVGSLAGGTSAAWRLMVSHPFHGEAMEWMGQGWIFGGWSWANGSSWFPDRPQIDGIPTKPESKQIRKNLYRRPRSNPRRRNHLATPSPSSSAPNGMHPSTIISANQPVFVLAPVAVNPPSSVTNSTSASSPDPRIVPPHCNNSRVPSPGNAVDLVRSIAILNPAPVATSQT